MVINWFALPMNDTSWVNVLKTAQHLIDQKLYVIVCQTLRSNYVVQISTHQMRNEINLLERLQCIPVIKSIQQPDDVLMIHVLQQPKLAKCPLSVSRRLKWTIKLLDCNFGASLIVNGRAEKFVMKFVLGLSKTSRSLKWLIKRYLPN